MRAATQTRYGSPDVLVEVHASPVTQGDRRLRTADFPGIMRVPGRLMMGVFGPRQPVPGTAFAGRVVAVGAEVTRFAVGDDVFGSAMHGAHAELLALPEDGPLAPMPRGFTHAEAAALPYGGLTSLVFLRDLARLQPGERVLVLGASGGVGRLAVQLAKHLGAHVTGTCGRDADLVRELGADQVLAHDAVLPSGQRWDVVFDASGHGRYRALRPALAPRGRYLSVHITLGLLCAAAFTRLVGDRRAHAGVALPTPELLEEVAALAEEGAFRPVLARRFPLGELAAAHAFLEAERPRGTVLIDLVRIDLVRIDVAARPSAPPHVAA